MTRAMRRVVEAGVAVVLVALGVGQAAAAAEGGLYVSLNYGRAPSLFAHSQLDEALVTAFNQQLTLESSSVGKHENLWSAGVGYRMSRHFAIEASYLDLGRLKYHASGSSDYSGTTQSITIDMDTKSRGATLALVFSLPLWDVWGIDVRTGTYFGRTSSQFVSVSGEDTVPGSDSANSTSLLFGVGGSCAVTDHLVVRLDYLRLDPVKEKVLDASFHKNALTAGVSFVF